jgi:hypothetical protein
LLIMVLLLVVVLLWPRSGGMEQRGCTANARSNSEAQSLHGRGTLVGNVLTVELGNSTPTIYALGPDGRLTGLWAGGEIQEILVPER